MFTRIKKFTFAVLLICLLAVLFCKSVVASVESNATTTQTPTATQETLPVIQEPQPTPVSFDYNHPIKVGYYYAYNDFIEDWGSPNKKGFGYDVFQKIEEVSDLQFEYVAITGDMNEAVNRGVVDVGGFLVKTDERAQEVLYSTVPFSKTYIALMTDDMSVQYADPAAIDGKTVSTIKDSVGIQYLERFCDAYGISVEYVYGTVNNYIDIEADFYITHIEDAYSAIGNNVLNLAVYNLFLVTSFENQELMDKITTIFLDIVATEGNFFLELEEKYMSHNLEISHRSLMKSEIETLRQQPLEVGYIADYQPISFQNEKGLPDGAMVEILDNFAESYGFEVNYHPYSLEDDPATYQNYDVLLTIYGGFEHYGDHYVSGESFYDLTMIAQIPTELHMQSPTTKELIENAEKIGLLPYRTIGSEFFEQYFPDVELITYTDWHQLLDDFSAGEVGIIISTDTGATYAQMYLDSIDSVAMHTDLVVPMQLLVSKEIADQYIPIFNVMFDRVSDEEYRTILSNHANNYLPETTPLDFLKEYWHFVVAGILIIAAGFIALFYHGRNKKNQALLTSYNTDILTGLMSINKFAATMDETLKKAVSKEYELISFDIDMFKTINTHFSTDKGTEIIIAISDALKNAFKNTSALLCRRTADQFLILRRVNEGPPIKQLYEHDILPSIRENINSKYNVTLSFGNFIIENTKEKVPAIVGQTDTAKKHGKNSHKTTFITFDSSMRKLYEDKINITFRMEQALKDNEFVVEYQPKIDLNSLSLSGAEALVRWHPKLGEKVYPDAFIPVFEQNGFISYLDLFVLKEVCKCIQLNCETMQIPCISINLSAHTILSDNIVERISDIMSIYDVKPESIEFELTESAIESDTKRFLAVVKKLKGLGFSISIDDFGAGVSSLNRLSAVEADVLKLDKAFFDLKEQGGKSRVVVADVISMAKHLDMKVVAEGVETVAQALWLRQAGCEYAQGYFFEKPMSVDDFKQLLISKKLYSIQL